MRSRQLLPSRWILALAGVALIFVASGCGRVDLEDLTPEAFRTPQAQTGPTATIDPNATAPVGETATAADGGGAPQGDTAAGASIYNAECSGCHEGGRAASLKGKVFDPAVEIPKLRSGEGFGVPHPVYRPTDIRPLNDNDLQDIFAYLAVQ